MVHADPLVSVVVVNFRGAADTVACLHQLAGELAYPNFEVICVDNASGGDDADALEAAAKALPGARITVLRSDVNRGFAGGCNLGASHANGTGWPS